MEGPEEEQRALGDEAAEIRRRIEAGAGTPEELRDLAAQLRAHRERERQLWERTVKPTLSRKGSDSDQTRRSLLIGLGTIGCVGLVVLIGLSGSGGLAVLVLAAVAAIAYAASRGRR